MKSRITRALLGISLVSLLSGCAAVGSALNPYEDDFKCSKRAPFGTCETTTEVYNDLVAAPAKQDAAPVVPEPGLGVPSGYEIVPAPESLPTYSVDTSSTKERYVVTKKSGQLEEREGSNGLLPQSDGADGVVYPVAAPAKPPVSASAPAAAYTVRPKPETAYRDASLAKAAKLLKEPVTPVVIPPLVMRILILPRKGEDGELNMAQFSFVMVDKPRWSMGDYLQMMPEE